MILTYDSILFPKDAYSPQKEDPTHVLIQSLYYSTARRELAHALEKPKLPLDVPTVTGINFSIPKHTQDKVAWVLIRYIIPTKILKPLYKHRVELENNVPLISMLPLQCYPLFFLNTKKNSKTNYLSGVQGPLYWRPVNYNQWHLK